MNGHHASDRDHDKPALLSSATSLDVRGEINLLKNASQRNESSVCIGTRNSILALAQAYLIQATLASLFPDNAANFTVAPMSTAGDRDKIQPLYLMGGKALWTQELEVALIEGGIDMIVHCLKDMPTSLPEGCHIGAIIKRDDPRDCVVVKQGLPYKRLEDLPDGSVVGTGSVRRVALLRRAFPKLLFADVRGNIDTRLKKLDDPKGPFTAIILAAAGLNRMKWDHRISSLLQAPQMHYAIGQGALAIETRTNDPRIAAMVAKINCWKTALSCRAERELLRTLEGGCSVPVGCETWLETEGHPEGSGLLHLEAVIASLAGDRAISSRLSRVVSNTEEAEQLGLAVALDLISKGGKQILEELGRTIEEKDFAARHVAAVKRKMDQVVRGETPPADESQCGVSPLVKTRELPALNGSVMHE